ncbi:MAG: YeeE/YedE family protein, partial [Chlorobiales bacterium]|nr:YeeE/YedE family protein [Chlorobiales bacterium]
VNPTFIWSALVGGLIMGLGFVVGGFCPGTSVCAAAIGKIDAMLFIGGSVLGVLFFAEGYPMFEGLYKAAFWGYPTIFTSLGIPRSLFAFLLVAIALMAFWAVSIIENKVNGIKEPSIRLTPYYVSLASVGVLMALSAFVLPERREAVIAEVEVAKPDDIASLKKMTPDELAYRIMEGDSKLQIVDFSSADDFKKFNLPKSVSYTVDNLFEKEPSKLLSVRHKVNVFVAQDEAAEIKAALVAKKLGFKNIEVLQDGIGAFRKEILDFKPDAQHEQEMNEYTVRFRTKASQVIPVLIEQNKAAAPVKKKVKRVLGGC